MNDLETKFGFRSFFCVIWDFRHCVCYYVFKIDINKIPDASNIKFGIVVSNWNSDITNNLLKGSLDLLKSKNVSNNNIKVINVPGSFELIYGCKNMQEKN